MCKLMNEFDNAYSIIGAELCKMIDKLYPDNQSIIEKKRFFGMNQFFGIVNEIYFYIKSYQKISNFEKQNRGSDNSQILHKNFEDVRGYV